MGIDISKLTDDAAILQAKDDKAVMVPITIAKATGCTYMLYQDAAGLQCSVSWSGGGNAIVDLAKAGFDTKSINGLLAKIWIVATGA